LRTRAGAPERFVLAKYSASQVLVGGGKVAVGAGVWVGRGVGVRVGGGGGGSGVRVGTGGGGALVRVGGTVILVAVGRGVGSRLVAVAAGVPAPGVPMPGVEVVVAEAVAVTVSAASGTAAVLVAGMVALAVGLAAPVAPGEGATAVGASVGTSGRPARRQAARPHTKTTRMTNVLALRSATRPEPRRYLPSPFFSAIMMSSTTPTLGRLTNHLTSSSAWDICQGCLWSIRMRPQGKYGLKTPLPGALWLKQWQEMSSNGDVCQVCWCNLSLARITRAILQLTGNQL
jgi:hypothetical protein